MKASVRAWASRCLILLGFGLLLPIAGVQVCAEDPDRPLERVISEFVARFPFANDPSTARLYDHCDKDPTEAARCFATYARDHNPRVRDLSYPDKVLAHLG